MSTTDDRNLGKKTGTEKGSDKAGLPLLLKTGKVVVLSVTDGPRKGVEYKLHKDRVVIGAVVSADVRLTGGGVSPIHAVLEILGGHATLYDLASDTGVYVNGSKVVTHRLQVGDTVQIAGVNLKFSLEDASVTSPKDRTRQSGGGQKLFLDPKEDLRPLNLIDDTGVEPIFDFRPSEKTALEVVMSWKGTILDVEHFTTFKEVTVGPTSRCDFGLPPTLGTRPFPLVERQAGSYTLNLDPKMRGVIQRKGSLQTVAQARGQISGGLPLDQGDFAKISVGEVDFYLSFTAAPPRLKRQRLLASDPFLTKVVLTSLAFTGMLLVAINQVSVPATLEAEQLPERIATILYQPEKYAYKPRTADIQTPKAAVEPPVTPPKPPEPKKEVTKIEIKPNPENAKKPIPKIMDVAKPQQPKTAQPPKQLGQNQAKEGEGARAKGKEGTRGTKNAKNTGAPQTVAMRPSAEGGQGRGGGNSQVEGEGNVDFLKGASTRMQDLLGSTANRLGKGGEKLQGFGAFNTIGKGGAALSGDGRGGGGTAEGLGGLGDKGRGGGRIGTGKGAAGNGSGIIGGKARVVIRTGGPEEAIVMGAIDAGAIEAALLAAKDLFRLCYENEVNFQRNKNPEPPKLSGRIGTNFVIGPSGRVTNAAVENTTLNSRPIEDCVLRRIKEIDFPAPRGGGIVQVTYPFKFSPSGG